MDITCEYDEETQRDCSAAGSTIMSFVATILLLAVISIVAVAI